MVQGNGHRSNGTLHFDVAACLPIEVWTQITSSLSLRECCMLASTCRALRGMRGLPCVKVVRSCASGEALQWAAKRWSSARLLQLHLSDSNVQQLTTALSCGSTPDDLASLQEVHVYISAQEKAKLCESAFCWLLSQAKQVQLLYADAAQLSCFPDPAQLTQLQHLVLDLRSPDFAAVSASLPAMAQLQTLSLSSEHSAREVSGLHLHLVQLQELRSIQLLDLVPDSIKLRDSCHLHLTLCCTWNAHHTVWGSVLPCLRSVRMAVASHTCTTLPPILAQAQNLARASLQLLGLGTADKPLLLDGALALVEDLSLSCKDLHAIVPSRIAWQNVRLQADNVLNISFGCVAAFAAAAPAFCFNYRALQGIALSQLALELGRRHPDWDGNYHTSHHSSMCFPHAHPLGACCHALKRCRCQACYDCLVAAGTMQKCEWLDQDAE